MFCDRPSEGIVGVHVNTAQRPSFPCFVGLNSVGDGDGAASSGDACCDTPKAGA